MLTGRLKARETLIVSLLLTLLIPLFAKENGFYNAIINTVDVYSFSSRLLDGENSTETQYLLTCDSLRVLAENDTCSLFDGRFEYIESEEEHIFISKLNFFPTRIDVTFEDEADIMPTINAFVCVNNTYIQEFSYLLHSVEIHFHKRTDKYTIPRFIDVQHHIHVAQKPLHKETPTRMGASFNITLGPNNSNSKPKLISRFPKIDFLFGLRKTGVRVFNSFPTSLSAKLQSRYKTLIKDKSRVDILADWHSLLLSPFWAESNVIQFNRTNDAEHFHLEMAYILLVLGRLSDVSHTTLFRCPESYFFSGARIIEGSFIWLVICMNVMALLQSLSTRIHLRPWQSILTISLLLVLAYLRPLCFIGVVFKVQLVCLFLVGRQT